MVNRHLSLRIEHAFVSGCVQVLRHWVAHYTFNRLAFFTRVRQASQHRLWVILDECLVVQIELADGLTALTC